MNRKKFFCYDGESTAFFSTEQGAVDAAEKAIAYWRADAIDDGEWPTEVFTVYWGEVHGIAQGFENHGDGSVDFRIVSMTEGGK